MRCGNACVSWRQRGLREIRHSAYDRLWAQHMRGSARTRRAGLNEIHWPQRLETWRAAGVAAHLALAGGGGGGVFFFLAGPPPPP